MRIQKSLSMLLLLVACRSLTTSQEWWNETVLSSTAVFLTLARFGSGAGRIRPKSDGCGSAGPRHGVHGLGCVSKVQEGRVACMDKVSMLVQKDEAVADVQQELRGNLDAIVDLPRSEETRSRWVGGDRTRQACHAW